MTVLDELRGERLDQGLDLSLSILETVGECPHWIVVVQDCGNKRLVPVTCSDPLCVPCSKIRAARVRARWYPILKRMRAPRMITLTMSSDFDLARASRDFKTSFRRLLDLRLGERGLAELVEGALDFVCNPSDDLPQDRRQDILSKVKLWEHRIGIFKAQVERKRASKGKAQRFRDVIGPGFASVEVTWSDDNGWHFHRHLTTDGAFIPWPVLVVAWTKATQGKGKIVDIRAVDKSDDSIQELIKYVCKPWEIPADRADELRKALRGTKRIWPLGGAHPFDVQKPCPFCKRTSCRCRPVSGDLATVNRGKLADDTPFVTVTDGDKTAVFILRDSAWIEASALDLIQRGFACQAQAP